MHTWAPLVAQKVKNLPAMWKTRVQSLHWEDPLEKGMATLSSILAWRIPWTEEPGRLQSMGLQKNGHNSATFSFGFPGGSDGRVCLQCGRPWFDPWVEEIAWKRKWQPAPVFLPGKSQEWRSLAGYSPWGRRVGHDWATSLSTFYAYSIC